MKYLLYSLSILFIIAAFAFIGIAIYFAYQLNLPLASLNLIMSMASANTGEAIAKITPTLIKQDKP